MSVKKECSCDLQPNAIELQITSRSNRGTQSKDLDIVI